MNPRFSREKWHAVTGTQHKGSKLVKETKSLPATPIQEGLHDPAAHKRVLKYAQWFQKNAGGLRNDDNSRNQRNDLVEAAKLKAEHDKTFTGGLEGDYSPEDFIFGRTRTTKPKGRK